MFQLSLTQITSTFKSVFVVSTLMSCLTLAVPVLPPATVDNPCRTIGQHQPELGGSLKQELWDTLTQLEKWQAEIKRAVHVIADEGLLTSRMRTQLDELPYLLSGLPLVPSKVSKLNKGNMSRSLEVDHQDIQRLAIFSDILQAEESGNDLLKSSLLSTKHFAYVCLCRVDSLLRLNHIKSTHFLTDSIMTDQVKSHVTSEDKGGWTVSYLTLVTAEKRVALINKQYRDLYESLS